MTTFGEVKRWRAAPLGQAADDLKGDRVSLEKSRDLMADKGFPDAWSGLPAFSARIRHAMAVNRLKSLIENVVVMERALADAETLVSRIEREVENVEGRAVATEFSIGADAVVSDISTPPKDLSIFEAVQWRLERRRLQQEIVDDLTEILADAAAADATLARAVPAGASSTIDERGQVSPETAEVWAKLSDAERRRIIEESVREQAAASGIDPAPQVVFEDLGNLNGESRDGEVAFNSTRLDNPDILHTVAHEMRHERQQQAIRDANPNLIEQLLIKPGAKEDPFDKHEADGITREQAEEWRKNSGPGYKRSEDDFEEYYNQPVEKDARKTGRDFVNDLTPEELERLERESR